LEKTGEAVVKGTVNGRVRWCVQGLKGIKPTTAMMIEGKDDVRNAEDFTDERVIQALLRVREAFSNSAREWQWGFPLTRDGISLREWTDGVPNQLGVFGYEDSEVDVYWTQVAALRRMGQVFSDDMYTIAKSQRERVKLSTVLQLEGELETFDIWCMTEQANFIRNQIFESSFP
jgi:hypothetical protein